jgi:hypothetical protein
MSDSASCCNLRRNGGIRHTHRRHAFSGDSYFFFGGACVKAEAAADFSRAVDVGSLRTLLAALAACARVSSFWARTCVSADAAADFSRAVECGSRRTRLAALAALEPVDSLLGFLVAMRVFPLKVSG